MTEKDIQEVLDELNTVRPEMLNESGKRLFEAVMQIADKRDDLQQRIDKAVEYIKQNEKEYGSLEDNEKILLDILKGSDKK